MRSRLAVALSVLLIALAGCTAGPAPSDPATGGGGAATPLPPGVQASPDPAPAATARKLAIRADAVRRAGRTVRIELTVITTQAASGVWLSGLKLSTNDGQSLAMPSGEERKLDINSQAALSLETQLPENSTATGLTLTWSDATLAIPLQADDGTVVWRPAALRQAGLPAAVQVTEKVLATVDTIRSEGMITEVTANSWMNQPGWVGAELCGYNFTWDNCRLVESDGTEHPLVGHGPEEKEAYGRGTGVLRFAGELKPTTTDLQLFIGGSAAFDPIPLTLPSHADSPAQAVAGSGERPAVVLKPARKLTLKKTGATFSISQVDVLRDRVQVRAVIQAGKKGYPVNTFTASPSEFTLSESSGLRHFFVPPSSGDVSFKGRAEVTLVFQGPVQPDSTSLQLTLSENAALNKTVNTSFDLPAIDPAPPAAEARLGELGLPEPAPAVTDVQFAATPPAPGKMSIAGLKIVAAPQTSFTDLGPIRTFVSGVSAKNTPEDPTADEQAQRTLEDMGAKRTPDGWVLTLPETVLFDYNSDVLRGDAGATLTKVAALLKHFSKAKIGVQGHTDNTGSSATNADLSNRRANSVADALAADGVAKSRMTIKGFGESRPIASNGTDAGRQKNRRVEIVLRQAD